MQTQTSNTETARKWQWLRVVAMAASGGLILTLFLAPETGTRFFWNLFIPLVPVIAVFLPGWWRNVCPMATTASAGKVVTRKAGRRMSIRAQGIAAVGSVVLIGLITPLRHLVLDMNGPATAITLLAAAAAAVTLGSLYLDKSGWCAGWCPVVAVEKLYGQVPAFEGENARCTLCSHCVALCPDTMRSSKSRTAPTAWHGAAETIMTGGFVGFVWGWFQVPNQSGALGLQDVVVAYGMPLLGAAVTLTAYLILKETATGISRERLIRVFGAAAVICYYWFRLPALCGFSVFAGDGVLLDLSRTLPDTFPWLCRIVSTTVLAVWMLDDNGARRWMLRPPTKAAA